MMKRLIYKNGFISEDIKKLSAKIDKLKILENDIQDDKLQVTTQINGKKYDSITGESIYINKTFTKIKNWVDKNPNKAGMISAGLIVYSIGSLCKKYKCLSAPSYSSSNFSNNHKSHSNNKNTSQDSIKFNITGFDWNFGVPCSYYRYDLIHKNNSSHTVKINKWERSKYLDGGFFDGSQSNPIIKDNNGNFGGNWEFEFSCQNSSTGRDEKVFYKSFNVQNGTKNIELKINYGNGTVRVVD